MQAYSPVLPVGAQHHYKSGFDALKTIFKAEGVRGMFRGIDAAILRTGMGSSVRTCAPFLARFSCQIEPWKLTRFLALCVQVQLPSYYYTKNALVNNGISGADSAWTYFISSSVSGTCVCVSLSLFFLISRGRSLTLKNTFMHTTACHAARRYRFDQNVQPAHRDRQRPEQRSLLQEPHRLCVPPPPVLCCAPLERL